MIRISLGAAFDIASIMPVMTTAFDPAYGEAWTSSQCLAALTLPCSQLLIAREGNDIAGFAISRWVLDEEELLMIGVAPRYQRQGVAAALLDEIISGAQADGRSRIFLEVRDNNSAQLFYKSAGFEQIGRRKQYYRGIGDLRHDAITMSINVNVLTDPSDRGHIDAD